jgi:hypothetical protein
LEEIKNLDEFIFDEILIEIPYEFVLGNILPLFVYHIKNLHFYKLTYGSYKSMKQK